MKTGVIAAFVFLLASSAGAETAPVRVLCSNGVKATMEELKPAAERAIGHPISIDFSSTAGLNKRIQAGEAFDAAILTSEAIEDLAKAGKIAPVMRKALARSAVGLGIRAGTPKPDIGTPAALKQSLLHAKSITYAQDGASRAYIEKMFERLGIASDVKPKVMLGEGSTRAARMVADGQSEMIITLISEIVPVPGLELAGPLPVQLEYYVNFAAGAAANAKNPDAAKALIGFLTGPAAAPVLKAKGLEPR